MTLRPTDEEQQALHECAAAEGISMQDAAHRAIRDYVARQDHRNRVVAGSDRISEVHAEALDRLGR